MPGSVLSTGDDVVMYEDAGPCLHGVVILVTGDRP